MHRVSGAYELRKRVRPDGAAPFLHRPSGVCELPQAGSPFPGGKVFAEPQRGIRRLRTAGASRRPPRWAKRKDNLRFSFLFELLPFPCVLIRRRFPICDRFENRERQSGYLSVCFATYSQFTDRLLLHIRATLRWVRHKVNCPKGKRGSPGGYPCRATLWRVTTHDTYEFRYSVPFIFAAPFYHNALTNRAALSCRAL